MKLLELFSGTGNLSRIARERGWETVTIDNDPAMEPDILADIREFETTKRYTLVWASPTCAEYTKDYLPFRGIRGNPDLTLWEACERLAKQGDYYCIENVMGARKFHGKENQHCGSRLFWTNLSPIQCPVKCYGKEKLFPQKDRWLLRSKLPDVLCNAVLDSVELGLFT